MKKAIIVAALAGLAFAARTASTGETIEGEPAKQECRITTQRYTTAHDRCPRNTVATAVQIVSGDIAILDCAILRVVCQ